MPVAAEEQEALDVWDWREVAWGVGSTVRKCAEKRKTANSTKRGCGEREN